MLDSSSKVFVAGHQGMVGSAIMRSLNRNGFENIVTRSKNSLDLRNQREVDLFFGKESFDQVYLAAARVGGIFANNTFPAQFIYENLMIEANVINAAFNSGVKKLLFLGSSCIYPKLAKQPMSESELLSGQLEVTNEPYAIAKIAGIKLCESFNRQYGISHGIDFRSVMPTNLYGPGDNYHLENSHVIPALLRRFHEAKLEHAPYVKVWGTGNPMREFLHVDDLAGACIHILNIEKTLYDSHIQPTLSHINVGSGKEISIKDLSTLMADIVEYRGQIVFDSSKPDGTPRKLLDSSLASKLGWKSSIDLRAGLEMTYQHFLKSNATDIGIGSGVKKPLTS